MNRVPSRGMAALKNWKRPSMDELPAPTEPWAQVRPLLRPIKLKNVLYCSYAVVLDDKKIKICPLLLNRIQLMY
jgi:hypothetical protein